MATSSSVKRGQRRRWSIRERDWLDTIIATLEWAKQGQSERQLADAAGIVRVRGASLDRSYLDRWIDELDLRAEWERVLGLAE